MFHKFETFMFLCYKVFSAILLNTKAVKKNHTEIRRDDLKAKIEKSIKDVTPKNSKNQSLSQNYNKNGLLSNNKNDKQNDCSLI